MTPWFVWKFLFDCQLKRAGRLWILSLPFGAYFLGILRRCYRIFRFKVHALLPLRTTRYHVHLFSSSLYQSVVLYPFGQVISKLND